MRRTAGLSQAALSARSGVPQSEISRIERDRTTPSLARVERLATAMGGHVELVGPPVRIGRSVREGREGPPAEPAWVDIAVAAILWDGRLPEVPSTALDGIETGVRQLRRTEPLQTETIQTASGPLTLPTRAEILRIKAYLILVRNATRDYLDFAALYAGMAEENALASLELLDRLYPQEGDPGGVRQQLLRQLAEPRPWDLDAISVAEDKGIVPPWTDWDAVSAVCRGASDAMVDAITDALPGWQDVAGP